MAAPQASTSLRAAKAALRQQIIQQRDALDATTRIAAGARITDQILSLECFRGARCVLAYASMGSELDTAALLSHAIAEKKLVLPRVDKATRALQLFFVTDLEQDLQSGVWGIREPHPDRCMPAPLGEIDLVLAPGVAFTRRGERLGYGAGYYDQLIARFAPRPDIVVAAFDTQIVPDVPLSETDMPVDIVVTETAIYRR
jgi:5,10-methenyltetrahydrofolate synthetase